VDVCKQAIVLSISISRLQEYHDRFEGHQQDDAAILYSKFHVGKFVKHVELELCNVRSDRLEAFQLNTSLLNHIMIKTLHVERIEFKNGEKTSADDWAFLLLVLKHNNVWKLRSLPTNWHNKQKYFVHEVITTTAVTTED
jgi:hypothetical protein